MISVSEEYFRKSLVSVQWGSLGCFLTIKYDRGAVGPMELGARIEIAHDLSIPINPGIVTKIITSGTWYVYDLQASLIAAQTTMRLVRQPNLHKYGDGSVMTFKKIAEMYTDFEKFNESDVDYYFTFTNNVRFYKIITHMAHKININKLPVFELNGQLNLYNLDGSIVQTILLPEADLKFPPVSSTDTKYTYDYFMRSRLGEPFKVLRKFFSPGTIYTFNLHNEFVSDEKYLGPRYICRDVIVFRDNDQVFTANSFFLYDYTKRYLSGKYFPTCNTRKRKHY